MRLPSISPDNKTREFIDVFGGYNHNPRINDNEFYDMQNLSSDAYPLLAVRKKRGTIPSDVMESGYALRNNGMIYRDKLYYIVVYPDPIDLSATIPRYTTFLIWHGVITPPQWNSKYGSNVIRQIIPMGAKMIILPDKVVVNTATGEHYNIENENQTAGTSSDVITVQPCLDDGTTLSVDYVGDKMPVNPPDGYVWLDTSLATPAMKKYYASTSIWQPFISTYVLIRAGATNIGSGFEEGDGIRIAGFASPLNVLNSTSIIRKIIVEGQYKKAIVIEESLDVVSSSGILQTREAHSGTELHFLSDTNDATQFAGKDIKLGDNSTWHCSSARLEEGTAYTYEVGDSTISTIVKTMKSRTTEDQNNTSTIKLDSNYISNADPDNHIIDGATVAWSTEELQTVVGAMVRFGENGVVATIQSVATEVGTPTIMKIVLDKSVSVPAGTTIYSVTQIQHPDKYMIALTFESSKTVKAGEKACISIETQYSQTTQITLSRKMPLMDFVIESQNRLWGCRYGSENEDGTGNFINEIYCSKLGDEKNWEVYDGVNSTNSYRATIGSEGEWTGVFNFRGYPVFFKEHHIHSVLGSNPPYQINDTIARGVQKGSSGSLAMVNEVLYYKSTHGVMAYSGGLPVEISAAFGDESYSDARACAFKNKYYISMISLPHHIPVMMVYDTARGLWHKEDVLFPEQFAVGDDDVYFVEIRGQNFYTGTLFGGDDTSPIIWNAETGLLGLETVDRKYISRINLRIAIPFKSEMRISIMYDSSGVWEPVGHVIGNSTIPFVLPIKPRRCDHFRLRLEGTGDMKLYSISKTISQGSDI